MTNPLRRTAARALRALGVAALASSAALTVLAGPASASAPTVTGFDPETKTHAWEGREGWVCVDGYYRIRTPFSTPQGSDNVLDMSLATPMVGTIIQHEWHTGSNQQWGLCYTGSGSTASFALVNRRNGRLCMGIGDASRLDASWLATFDCGSPPPDHQTFSIIRDPADRNRVLLQLHHSGNFVAVSAPGERDAVVAQYSYRATQFTLEWLG
ncbi:RICIN domain-containing protein [Kitasatospora sp. NPDC048286]|uniref:RICIN domain-containing protein n=1 Tax=Kitasatospora sp. NPDC048286 TaxID=3364047 RepID=UPI0037198FC8